jgi:hypothetical protein
MSLGEGGSAKAGTGSAFDGIAIDSSTRIIDIIIVIVINQGVAPRGSRHGRCLCRRRDGDGDDDDDGTAKIVVSIGLGRCLFLFLSLVLVVDMVAVTIAIAVVSTVVSDQQ